VRASHELRRLNFVSQRTVGGFPETKANIDRSSDHRLAEPQGRPSSAVVVSIRGSHEIDMGHQGSVIASRSESILTGAGRNDEKPVWSCVWHAAGVAPEGIWDAWYGALGVCEPKRATWDTKVAPSRATNSSRATPAASCCKA